MPNGQLNIVTGTGPDVGAAMTRHPDTDMVSFTGSSAVGEQIASTAAATMKRVALELGDKGANIIFADADLDAVVEGAVQAFIVNQGQECCASSRLLIERSIANVFQQQLVERCEGLRIGMPLEDTTELGPLIQDGKVARVLDYIRQGRQSGARLITAAND